MLGNSQHFYLDCNPRECYRRQDYTRGKNEESQEVIDNILQRQDYAIFYIMMNVREHIIHHIFALTFSSHMCKTWNIVRLCQWGSP